MTRAYIQRAERAERRVEELTRVLRQIREKVHAHNRGGELYAGLRDVIRNMCDLALKEEDNGGPSL